MSSTADEQGVGSTKPARIAENFDIFDFELSGDDIGAIDALDTGVRGGPEPDSITLEATAGRPLRRERTAGLRSMVLI